MTLASRARFIRSETRNLMFCTSIGSGRRMMRSNRRVTLTPDTALFRADGTICRQLEIVLLLLFSTLSHTVTNGESRIVADISSVTAV